MARSRWTEQITRTALALAVLVCVPLTATAAEPELRFSRHSELVATRTLSSLRDALKPGRVTVFEPYEKIEVSFDALPFPAVLDAVYGPSWREEEELLFTCRDGYQPAVPVARFLAHAAWLAFDRADQPGFEIDKRESGVVKRIDLAPFYLVWENRHDAQVRQEADYGWPYQLVGVELIRRLDRFPKLSPPADATSEVLAGFGAFRIHCSKCHPVHGEGGTIGPELAAHGSLLAVRDAAWLRGWIDDPESVRPGTRMPALNPELPERERTIAAVVAYLEAMVARPVAAEAP